MKNAHRLIVATLAGCIAAATAAPATASDRRVIDTHIRGSDAFTQNKEASRLLRKIERSEARRENHRIKAPKRIKTISAGSNRY